MVAAGGARDRKAQVKGDRLLGRARTRRAAGGQRVGRDEAILSQHTGRGGGYGAGAGRLGSRSPAPEPEPAVVGSVAESTAAGGGNRERRCTGERTASVRDEGTYIELGGGRAAVAAIPTGAGTGAGTGTGSVWRRRRAQGSGPMSGARARRSVRLAWLLGRVSLTTATTTPLVLLALATDSPARHGHDASTHTHTHALGLAPPRSRLLAYTVFLSFSRAPREAWSALLLPASHACLTSWQARPSALDTRSTALSPRA